MWTTKNRPRYDRDKLRYPSDRTDEEGSLVESLIPPAKRGGRRREVVVREVVNGVRCSMNWHELQVTVREPGSDMPARPI